MTPNGEFTEEKIYTDKYYIDNKEVIYPERFVQDVKYVTNDEKFVTTEEKFVTNEVKFVNGVPEKYALETKEIVGDKYSYQYDDVTYQDGNGFDRQDKKTGLKIKLRFVFLCCML